MMIFMENKNIYVSFVSDDNFEKCVKNVLSAYTKAEKEFNFKTLQKNVVDPIKMVFDIYSKEKDVDQWLNTEKIRQADKTVNNAIGTFHQEILGCVDGWNNLGTGHETGADLKNDEGTIYIELKNKHNTLNSEGIKKLWEKLEVIVTNNENCIAYWAYVISKRDSGIEPFIVEIRNKNKEVIKTLYNERIKIIKGGSVYELVTGDSNNINKLWEAIPLAINNLKGGSFDLDESQKQRLAYFFKYAFEYNLRNEILIQNSLLTGNFSVETQLIKKVEN